MRSTPTARRCAAALALAGTAALTAAACTGTDDGATSPATTTARPVAPGPVVNGSIWPMHSISARYKGSNALSAADVNGDGLLDYATNFEFDQRYVIALHPGADGDVTAPWPTVTVFEPEPMAPGYGVNTESAALGDVDGDGNVDLVGAQGYSTMDAWEGSQPGVKVFWGPAPDQASDPGAWIEAGRVPGTVDVGHLHWVQIGDIDGDGLDDVLGGGRVHEGNGSKGGVFWIEAPADPDRRRSIEQWQVHPIDAETWSGHGAVLADVDADGDLDVTLANHDFDTPEGERTVVWYENPGDADAVRQPWEVHELYRGDEFHTKPQVSVDDLDDDGDADIVTMTPDEVSWFRQTDDDPVTFERIVIPKDPVAQGLSRPIRIVDLDGDGRKDLVGMRVHEDADLPGDSAAVFWMRYEGDDPASGRWSTQVIKWGAGTTSLITEFGEKYDQVRFDDVDGDGDLDIVANNEEWWADGGAPSAFWNAHAGAVHALVWFENRLDEEPYRFEPDGDGGWSIEAEHHSDLADGTWVPRNVAPSAGSTASTPDGPYLQAGEMLAEEGAPWEASGGARFDGTFPEGTYDLVLRCRAPATWGFELGGSLSDELWVGLDGEPLEGPIACPVGEAWAEVSVSVALTAGDHTVELRQRDGGVMVDALSVRPSG